MPTVKADAGPAALEVDSAAVNALLAGWAKAWSNKDADTYLGYYANDFQPEGGLARNDWEQQRRDRVVRPKSIAVRALSPEIVRIGDDRVRVSFVQEYKSDAFSDQVSKVLELKAGPGGYKIVREYIR